MKSLGGSTQQDFRGQCTEKPYFIYPKQLLVHVLQNSSIKIPGISGGFGTLWVQKCSPTVTGCETKCKPAKQVQTSLSNTSRYSSPGTICSLPALLSHLNPAFLTPRERQRGLEGSLQCGAGGAKAAGTMHDFVYLTPCWNTTESCFDSQGCTCLQLGRGKKHHSLEGQDLVTYLIIPTASPVLHTLECMKHFNWLKDYWFYFQVFELS